MRIVLSDLASADGFVSKDTVAGGYGSRLRPFSKVTRVISALKKHLHSLPSVQLGYVAAMCAEAGHEVVFTDGKPAEGDAAIVLSSLVDYRRECAWAEAQRARGVRTGFVGLAASKLPELFEPHADFIVMGEPEQAIARLAAGEPLSGRVPSPPVKDLSTLPFQRWDLVGAGTRRGMSVPFTGRPVGGSFPLLASRGCPEFCTYCPHRILASYRDRPASNIVDESRARGRPGCRRREPPRPEARPRRRRRAMLRLWTRAGTP